MKITENSVVSISLVLTLCSVAWRSSKIESTANGAMTEILRVSGELKDLERYLQDRRNITETRLENIKDALAAIQADVRVIKSRVPL